MQLITVERLPRTNVLSCVTIWPGNPRAPPQAVGAHENTLELSDCMVTSGVCLCPRDELILHCNVHLDPRVHIETRTISLMLGPSHSCVPVGTWTVLQRYRSFVRSVRVRVLYHDIDTSARFLPGPTTKVPGNNATTPPALAQLEDALRSNGDATLCAMAESLPPQWPSASTLVTLDSLSPAYQLDTDIIHATCSDGPALPASSVVSVFLLKRLPAPPLAAVHTLVVHPDLDMSDASLPTLPEIVVLQWPPPAVDAQRMVVFVVDAHLGASSGRLHTPTQAPEIGLARRDRDPGSAINVDVRGLVDSAPRSDTLVIFSSALVLHGIPARTRHVRVATRVHVEDVPWRQFSRDDAANAPLHLHLPPDCRTTLTARLVDDMFAVFDVIEGVRVRPDAVQGVWDPATGQLVRRRRAVSGVLPDKFPASSDALLQRVRQARSPAEMVDLVREFCRINDICWSPSPFPHARLTVEASDLHACLTRSRHVVHVSDMLVHGAVATLTTVAQRHVHDLNMAQLSRSAKTTCPSC